MGKRLVSCFFDSQCIMPRGSACRNTACRNSACRNNACRNTACRNSAMYPLTVCQQTSASYLLTVSRPISAVSVSSDHRTTSCFYHLRCTIFIRSCRSLFAAWLSRYTPANSFAVRYCSNSSRHGYRTKMKIKDSAGVLSLGNVAVQGVKFLAPTLELVELQLQLESIVQTACCQNV